MTKSTPLDWHLPYLRKLASSCSILSRSFLLFFLSFIFVSNVEAQPESCSGKFSISVQRSFDGGKTTYTYTVTETGNVNNLSHFGFPVCENTNLTVEQLLAGYTAKVSTVSATGPWTTANTSYGPDNSQDCITGNIFKFNETMPDGITTIYFQLTINGNYSALSEVAYVKYGNQCCVLSVANGGCAEEICPPINLTTQPITVCETGATGSATVDLDNGVTSTSGGTRTFHTTEANADAGTNPISDMQSVAVGSPTTFWVRSTVGNCHNVASILVTVTDNPDVTTTNLTLCESGATGMATFNLNNGVVSGDGGTVTFHTSQAAADAGTGAIATPATYTSGNATIYVRSANGSCVGTASFTLTVTDNPDVTTQPIVVCETGTTGSATVDLDNGVTSLDGGTRTFHANQADAIAGVNPISDMQTVAEGVSSTFWVRSTNGSCFGVASILVTVNPNPTITGTALVCTGATTQLTGSPTAAAVNPWVSSNTSVATVSNTGLVTGVAPGTATITYTNNNGCMVTIIVTVEDCGGEGCSPGFWKNHPELWDGLGDVTPGNMPAGKKFTTTTDFSTYFGVNPSGFDNSLTMLGAISQGGGGCKALARHGVAALLSLAAGADITFPTGTSDFTSLYNAIKATLMSGNCSGTLLTQLEAISEGDHAPCDELKSRFRANDARITTVPNNSNPQMAARINVTSSPNPYNDRVQFKIESNISGRGSLVVYNMMGQKVKTVFEGYVVAGRGQVVELKIPAINRENLIYIFSVNGLQRTGKLINQRY
jgi:hypothetical protein